MATLVCTGTKHNVYEALGGRGRDLLSIRDLSGDQLASLIALGADIKGRARRSNGVLSETTVSMLLEKPSLRTRVSFDVAAHQLGAHATEKLLRCARADAVFMHCLPAHRGEEVEATVLDSPRSIVFRRAENRLHTEKAFLVALLRGRDLPT